MPSTKSQGPRAGIGGNSESNKRSAATKRANADAVKRLQGVVEDKERELEDKNDEINRLKDERTTASQAAKDHDAEHKRVMELRENTHKAELKRLEELYAAKYQLPAKELKKVTSVMEPRQAGENSQTVVNFYQTNWSGHLIFTGSLTDKILEVCDLEVMIMEEKKQLGVEIKRSDETFFVIKDNYERAHKNRQSILKRQVDLADFEAFCTNKKAKFMTKRLANKKKQPIVGGTANEKGDDVVMDRQMFVESTSTDDWSTARPSTVKTEIDSSKA